MLTAILLIFKVTIKSKRIFELLKTIADVAKSFLQNTGCYMTSCDLYNLSLPYVISRFFNLYPQNPPTYPHRILTSFFERNECQNEKL